MPTHFHWIVQINPELGTISDIMRDIKKYSAWDTLEALGQDGHTELLRLFSYKAIDLRDQKRKFWMRRFDDQVIRNSGMVRTKLEYIHNNPVAAGIVANPEEYKYSSARNYLLGDHSILEIQVNW